jgi:F-type H+-transporting ATPase subunit c
MNTTSHEPPLAGVTGNIASAFGLLGAAIGVGLIGLKAAEAVGRNPAASGKVLVQAIIGMALAEGLGILALFLAEVICLFSEPACPGTPPSIHLLFVSMTLPLFLAAATPTAEATGPLAVSTTFGLASNRSISSCR